MNSPIEEIKKAVAENRTSDALSRLLELSQSDKQVHDIIVIISGEFRDLNLQQLKGIIDNKEATQRLNAVHSRILDSLNLFDSQGKVLPGSVVGKKTSADKLLKITLFLFGLTAVLFILTDILHSTTQIDLSLTTLIPLIFGFITFVGFVIALVVNASKK